MADIRSALTDGAREVDEMVAAMNRAGAAWASPPAPGKWSPAQIVEHVARSFEASALDVHGQRSGFPQLPGLVRPVVRAVLFRRVLRTGTFPKAKTNKAMNPAVGPASPAEGAERLRTAWKAFETAVERATTSAAASSKVFGQVPLSEYIQFQVYHARHHRGQMSRP